MASSSCKATKLSGNGFGEFVSNGDDGIGIAAGQPATGDSGVIQTFGQESGSMCGMSWTQTDLGAEIASGTYTGTSGTLTADVDSDAFIQTLNIVSDGEWSGPGNIGYASVDAG